MDENVAENPGSHAPDNGHETRGRVDSRNDLLETLQKLNDKCRALQFELLRQKTVLLSTQNQLQQLQQRYSDIYHFSSLGYVSLDWNGTIIEVNLSSLDILGIDRVNLLGKSFSDFIVKDGQELFYRHFRRHIATGAKEVIGLHLKNEGDSASPVLVEIEIKAGRRSGEYLLQVNDISFRKEAEYVRLEEIRDKYRGIVMQQNDLICRFDLDGKITFVNDAYCRCFNTHYKEVLLTSFHPRVHEEDYTLFDNYLNKLKYSRSVESIEYRVDVGDRRFLWFQWYGRALYGKDGQIVEYQVVGRDITELKNTQTELQKELDLRQRFLDALPGTACLVDMPTRRILASNKTAVSYGVRVGEFCYKSCHNTNNVCPRCLGEEAVRTQKPLNLQQWKNGLFWDVHYIPVNKESFLQYGFDITRQQITREAQLKEHRQLSENVRTSMAELKDSRTKLLHAEKLAAIANISVTITHEFNNPLQSVMAILQGIKQSSSLETIERKLLNLAFDECVRMKNLVSDFRELYRPTTAVTVILNPHDLIDRLLLLVEKDYQARQIRVQRQYTGGLTRIRGIEDQLTQVFINLLSNSADACREGGEIFITTERAGGEIVIHFDDDGKGIAEDALQHIFKPFYTTKSESGGSGLGLSISQDIVRHHGGRITATSEPYKKTRFSIFLPLIISDDKP